jgi:hypothetical protein
MPLSFPRIENLWGRAMPCRSRGRVPRFPPQFAPAGSEGGGWQGMALPAQSLK